MVPLQNLSRVMRKKMVPIFILVPLLVQLQFVHPGSPALPTQDDEEADGSNFDPGSPAVPTQCDEEEDGSNFDLDPLLYQPRVMRIKMVPILILVLLLYLPRVMRKKMVPILTWFPCCTNPG